MSVVIVVRWQVVGSNRGDNIECISLRSVFVFARWADCVSTIKGTSLRSVMWHLRWPVWDGTTFDVSLRSVFVFVRWTSCVSAI
jgi:hypothetical protein